MQPFLVIQCLTEHVDTVLFMVCLPLQIKNILNITLK